MPAIAETVKPPPAQPMREVERVAAFTAGLGNVERVDVLPFHKLGAPKQARLGIPLPLAGTPIPSEELVRQVRARFAAGEHVDPLGRILVPSTTA